MGRPRSRALPLLLLGVLATSMTQDSGRSDASEGTVTLLARDDLGNAFSFRSGKLSGEIQDGERVLDGAQLVFDALEPNHLSVGFFYDELAQLVELGDFRIPSDHLPSDRAPQPSISVFHTLFLDHGHFHYRAPIRRTYRLKEADVVLGTFPADAAQHFEPVVGSTYVFAFKPRGGRTDSALLVKLQVLDFVPDRKVTFRWARIPRT